MSLRFLVFMITLSFSSRIFCQQVAPIHLTNEEEVYYIYDNETLKTYYIVGVEGVYKLLKGEDIKTEKDKKKGDKYTSIKFNGLTKFDKSPLFVLSDTFDSANRVIKYNVSGIGFSTQKFKYLIALEDVFINETDKFTFDEAKDACAKYSGKEKDFRIGEWSVPDRATLHVILSIVKNEPSSEFAKLFKDAYWSSSQENKTFSWANYFVDNLPRNTDRTNKNYVRCVKALP